MAAVMHIKRKYQKPAWKATSGWSGLGSTTIPFPGAGWYRSQGIPPQNPIMSYPIAAMDAYSRDRDVRMVNTDSPPVNEIPEPNSAEEAGKLMKPNCFDKKM